MRRKNRSKRIILLFATVMIGFGFLQACNPLWGTRDMLVTEQVIPAKITTTIESSPIIPTETNAPSSTPTLPPTFTVSPTLESIQTSTLEPTINSTNPLGNRYYTQSGDTLSVIASHFGINESEIISDNPLQSEGLIDPQTLVFVPENIDGEVTPGIKLIPDSEVVFSPSAIDFNVRDFIVASGGYLNEYTEYLGSSGITSGIDIVSRVAVENSINPRLLLAILEFQTGWVTGQHNNPSDSEYLMGYVNPYRTGLYWQLVLAAEKINQGYYGWRSGILTEINLSDGKNLRISPSLNAGTIGLYYYFSTHNSYPDWMSIIDSEVGFMEFYVSMMGDPWIRSQKVEPLFPPGLYQPTLSLPFVPGDTWSLTGGPHGAFQEHDPWAALDFGPGTEHTTSCYLSNTWVLASASGQVVRSGHGIVILDLDNDGYEQTGWNIMYLHIAARDRVPLGTLLNLNDRIGHPSCEGGSSTGVHLHVARKFNGEWILADGPLPFNLSGWVAQNGNEPYQGSLIRNDQIITASFNGTGEIVRRSGE